MKRLSKILVPHQWKPMDRYAIVCEADICIRRGSRLRAKLLVFRNKTALQKFWPKCLGQGRMHRATRGAVNYLCIRREKFDETGKVIRRIEEFDRRYYCLIALACGHLTQEVLVHECVHAGFAYAKRVKGVSYARERADEMDDELVCHPAGAIAARVTTALYEAGLIRGGRKAT